MASSSLEVENAASRIHLEPDLAVAGRARRSIRREVEQYSRSLSVMDHGVLTNDNAEGASSDRR
jgi:hypothetical protein